MLSLKIKLLQKRRVKNLVQKCHLAKIRVTKKKRKPKSHVQLWLHVKSNYSETRNRSDMLRVVATKRTHSIS
jgi:hypothetical protein